MHKQLDPQELIARVRDDTDELWRLLDTQRAEIIVLAHENRELLKEVQRLRATEGVK